MGLNEKSGSGGGNHVFLSPINVEGSGPMWARRVSADTDGAVERDAKCGLVHELYYESVDGMIDAVRIVNKGDYGELLEVSIKDGDLTMIMSAPFAGDIGKGFIVRMENLDETIPTEVGLFGKEDGNGFMKRFCYMTQGGQKVTHEYAKNGSKDLPQPVKVEKARGKTEWDWDDHDNALFDICEAESIKRGWAKDSEDFQNSCFKRDESKTSATPSKAPDEDQPADFAEDDVPL